MSALLFKYYEVSYPSFLEVYRPLKTVECP
jgi:hypothetical protein